MWELICRLLSHVQPADLLRSQARRQINKWKQVKLLLWLTVCVSSSAASPSRCDTRYRTNVLITDALWHCQSASCRSDSHRVCLLSRSVNAHLQEVRRQDAVGRGADGGSVLLSVSRPPSQAGNYLTRPQRRPPRIRPDAPSVSSVLFPSANRHLVCPGSTCSDLEFRLRVVFFPSSHRRNTWGLRSQLLSARRWWCWRWFLSVWVLQHQCVCSSVLLLNRHHFTQSPAACDTCETFCRWHLRELKPGRVL